MRRQLLSLLLVLAAAGCRTTQPPATQERQATLAPSGFVGLRDFAFAMDLDYRGDRAGFVELSYPPDSVVLVPGETTARVNGRPVSMDRPMIRMGDGYALSGRDAAKLEGALGDARRSRPAPVVRTPVPAPSKRVDFPAAWVPRAAERRWGWIIVHHSDAFAGNAASIDRFHRSTKGWENGLGYDFVIGNGSQSGDGEIEVGPRWRDQLTGAHTKVEGDATNRWNETGIGICLVGNFMSERPTSRQMDALVRLVNALRERYEIPADRVLGHGKVDRTDCPGTWFPWAELRRRMR